MKLNFKIKNLIAGEENRKNLKYGSYTSVMTVIVLALVIFINLIFSRLPVRATQIDVSEQKLFSIGEDTKNLVTNLTQDVNLYYIVKNGNENEYISKMLERYEDLSSHLKVEKIDPDLQPAFTAQYTEETVEENSIIVVSQEKSRVVSISDMLEQEINYYTYSYQTTGFDGEGQVTSAIAYVVSDHLPVVYQLTGHNEQPLGKNLTDSVTKNNIELKKLSLLTEVEVPEDASALLICSPGKDLSKDETDKILTYMEQGGNVILFTDYSEETMENLTSLLNHYGIQTIDGIVMEGDSGYHYPQRPDVLFPYIETGTGILSDLTKDTYGLVQDAQPIQSLEGNRDGLTVEPVLTTTEKGYVKQIREGKISFQKETGDEEGTFCVGVRVTEEIDENTMTQFIYFSSSSLVSDETDQYVSGGNTDLLIYILTKLCAMEETNTFSIPSKSFSVSYLLYSDRVSSIWKVMMIGIIPAAFLLTGFGIWMKRRKQ